MFKFFKSTTTVANAYVLDKDFERLKNDGTLVKRKAEVGDVMRFGLAPNGQITNIELIYDVNEDGESPIKNLKTIMYDDNGEQQTSLNKYTYYYMTVGVVTSALNHNDSYCPITTYKDNKYQNISLDVTGYSTKSILLYDLNAGTPTVKTAKMTDIQMGDMLIVNRTTNFAYNFIYAVRYSDRNLIDELNAFKNGTMSLNSADISLESFMADAALELPDTEENTLDELFGINNAEETLDKTEDIILDANIDTSEVAADTETTVADDTPEEPANIEIDMDDDTVEESSITDSDSSETENSESSSEETTQIDNIETELEESTESSETENSDE